jgi:formylglycine-generating enzyme required for sulfatase activity
VFVMNLGLTFMSSAAVAVCLAGVGAQPPAAAITWRDGATMLLVPAGAFVMGSGEGAEEDGPAHRRELRAFYIDRTEVTRDQYAAFLRATGTPAPATWAGSDPPPGTGGLPVTTVSWFDACRYAVWAGKRLPTEAEWERAARGSDGRRYPWGDADDPARRNLADDAQLRPTDAFPEGASPCGCLQLSGNAWEWTADWLEPYPGTSARSVHFGPKYKVIRGGGCLTLYGIPNSGTCTQRARLLPYGTHDGVGFRCAADLPGATPKSTVEVLLVICPRIN